MAGRSVDPVSVSSCPFRSRQNRAPSFRAAVRQIGIVAEPCQSQFPTAQKVKEGLLQDKVLAFLTFADREQRKSFEERNLHQAWVRTEFSVNTNHYTDFHFQCSWRHGSSLHISNCGTIIRCRSLKLAYMA